MAYITKYERELRKRLADSDSWPAFPNPDFASRLERVGLRALERRSTDGDVTAIVIFHQLAEQMLRVLVADTQFFLVVSAMPTPVTFHEPRRQTFGDVLQRVRFGVEFRRKDSLLSLAEALNNIRNDVAHRLLQRETLAGLRRDAQRARSLFKRIFSIYDTAHDEFRIAFHSLAKDLD